MYASIHYNIPQCILLLVIITIILLHVSLSVFICYCYLYIIILLLLLLLLLFNIIAITSCKRSTNLSEEHIGIDVTLDEVIERPSDGFQHVVQLLRTFVRIFAHQYAP